MILERRTLTQKGNLKIHPNPAMTRVTFTYASPQLEAPTKKPTLLNHRLPPLTPPLKGSPFVRSAKLGKWEKATSVQQKSVNKASRRKKIFENNSINMGEGFYSNENSVSVSKERGRNKARSALHYSQLRGKKKRNTIFKEYNPRANTSLENQTLEQRSTSLFPLKRPADPKNLVHYIDLQAYRKNEEEIVKNRNSKTYLSQLSEAKADYAVGFKVHEDKFEACFSNKNESVPQLQLDESTPQDVSIKDSPGRELDNFSEPFGVLLESIPRFYDKMNGDQIPPIPRRDSYVDANLLKTTNSSGWLKTLRTEQKKQDSLFLEELKSMYGKVLGNSNTLPVALLIFGLLLFVVQLIK